MKLNANEKMTIEMIRNLSKQNTSDINDYFKGLVLCALMNYSENEPMVIPYFGTMNIKYLGDETKAEGRVAKLDVEFVPSSYLTRNIGQLEDMKNPNCETTITQVDCIKEIMGDISKKLNEIMDKNS